MKFRRVVAANANKDSNGNSQEETNAVIEKKRELTSTNNKLEIPKLIKKTKPSPSAPEQKPLPLRDCNMQTEKGESGTITSNHKRSVQGKKALPYQFEYPTNVPQPSSEMLEALYKSGKEAGVLSKKFTSEHLPLEHVLFSAVCEMEDDALRRKLLKAKAFLKKLNELSKRDGCVQIEEAEEGTKKIIHQLEVLRSALRKIERVGNAAVRKSRRLREEHLEDEIVERKQAEKEKRVINRMLRAEAKKKAKKEREQRRKEKILAMKKVHPKNVEAWRDIMVLQTTLNKLKKEERDWKKTEIELDSNDKKLDKLEAEIQTRSRRSSVIELRSVGEEEAADFEPMLDVESLVKNTIEDITLSADRINQALRSVKELMNEADEIKKELYRKYTQHFQFKDYFKNGNKGVGKTREDVFAFMSQEHCSE